MVPSLLTCTSAGPYNAGNTASPCAPVVEFVQQVCLPLLAPALPCRHFHALMHDVPVLGRSASWSKPASSPASA